MSVFKGEFGDADCPDRRGLRRSCDRIVSLSNGPTADQDQDSVRVRVEKIESGDEQALKAGSRRHRGPFSRAITNHSKIGRTKPTIDRFLVAFCAAQLMQRLRPCDRSEEMGAIDARSKIVGDFIAAH